MGERLAWNKHQKPEQLNPRSGPSVLHSAYRWRGHVSSRQPGRQVGSTHPNPSAQDTGTERAHSLPTDTLSWKAVEPGFRPRSPPSCWLTWGRSELGGGAQPMLVPAWPLRPPPHRSHCPASLGPGCLPEPLRREEIHRVGPAFHKHYSLPPTSTGSPSVLTQWFVKL